MRPAPSHLLFPLQATTPVRSLSRRVGLAVAIVLFIALTTWIGRDGYRDEDGNDVSALDALYYATVTATTTGYGDIAPVSPGARAWTAFAVTPLRILFLIVLVGTTLELLTERFREGVRPEPMEATREGPHDRGRVRRHGARRSGIAEGQPNAGR